MPFDNAGFPETVADGADWHEALTKAAGRADGFPYVGHLRPSAQPGLVVRVAAGEMVSAGVWSKLDADVNMTALPTLPTGQRQYHMGVVRKTYGATAATHVTSLEVIAGDSNRILPAFQQTKGDVWETPVYLARVNGGSSTIAELVDLRVIAEQPGVYTIYDDMALQLIDHPGALAYNANTGQLQARVYGAGLGRAWVPVLTQTQAQGVVVDSSPLSAIDDGWYQDGNWCEARKSKADYRTTQLQVMLRRRGNTMVASGAGSFADEPLCQFDEKYRPLDQVVGTAYYYSESRSTYGCLVTLETDGTVWLRAGAPGIDLPRIIGTDNVGKPSIRASFTFLARNSG